MPTGDYATVEIEDVSQLEDGVRVIHSRLGEGVVRGTRQTGAGLRVMIAFGRRPPREVPVSGGDLQLLVD